MSALMLPVPGGAATFDYGTLASDDAAALQQAAERIRSRIRTMKQDAIAIGREILTVKDRLPHGALSGWVEAELGVTPRTAQNYMSAARVVDAMPEPARETVSLLPPATLYKLAAPSTPAEVIQEIAEAAERGSLPEPAAILHRIDAATTEQRELRRVMAKKPGRTEAEAKKIIRRSRAEAALYRDRYEREDFERRAAREAAKDAFNTDLRAWAQAHHSAADDLAAMLARHNEVTAHQVRILFSAIRGDDRE